MGDYVSSRGFDADPVADLKALFGAEAAGNCDAAHADSACGVVAGVGGLPFRAPAMAALLAEPVFAHYARGLAAEGKSLLVAMEPDGAPRFLVHDGRKAEAAKPNAAIVHAAGSILSQVKSWGGRLRPDGSQAIDLKSPLPGPHFAVNLLLGDRSDYAHPLQTTPKSVVDRLGRGSFRSHAATQVLATRWDLRQEENGFPCNRQFYLTENGEQIFYSADPADPRVAEGTCVHSQNRTEISYRLDGGLEIVRTIFILPQDDGLPLAVEAQRVEIRNRSPRARSLRIVSTGMFGPSKPGALMEDVLYSTIIMEGGMLRDGNGGVMALSPNYQPAQDRLDRRFASMVVHDANGPRHPREYSLDYTGFVGAGSLERPQGLAQLPNRLPRKGPGFFALAAELAIPAGGNVAVDHFVGLVSWRGNPAFGEGSLKAEVEALLARYARPDALPRALDRVKRFQEDFASSLRFETADPDFSAYASRNLPFQVLYQSFVSRSFAQTQKGYREIGFREIQDLYASMHYFHGMGKSALVRGLILQWAAQVHEFGYANHNFFWEGKEAGKWSDDALWLHQAVGRYVALTGDASILSATAPIASAGGRERTLLATLSAALRYSTEISVGPHGVPLLDLADWNDCLKIDPDYRSGADKEREWNETGALAPRGTESVMNGFLAVLAARELAALAALAGDGETGAWAAARADAMADKLRRSAWIGGGFARLLINDHPPFAYAGAAGDGLDTDGSGGTLFLNSFSWSVLSGVADEGQIRSMLALVKAKLKTPFGLKLVSPMDLSRVVPGVATSEYFPGDRENGAVFKHAAMMAVAALFDAAKAVADPALAAELAAEAWTMVDLAYPARTMADPFAVAGNPRFCTQYNNSETGENIGPLLSGTATWLALSLLKGFGVEQRADRIVLDPVLRAADRTAAVALRYPGLEVEIRFRKGEGFRRRADAGLSLTVDGKPVSGNAVDIRGKTGRCLVEAALGD